MNYNGFSRTAQTTFYARYNAIITEDSMSWQNPQDVQALRAANPGAPILAYERAAQLDYTKLNRYGSNAIYPGWWLLTAGSILSAPIDSAQTTIPVSDTSAFSLYDDVLVDGESMHIAGINAANKTLTVWRGFNSTAASHLAGARIATHAFLPNTQSLSNDDPINKPRDDRPWALNMSILCPRNPAGQRWIDYLASWMVSNVMSTGLWDGIFYDNTTDRLYVPALHPGVPLPPDYVSQVDVNNDGVVDGGIVNGVDVWEQGMAALFAATRAAFPGALLLNAALNYSIDFTNGQVTYLPDLTDSVSYGNQLAEYHYYMHASVSPTVTLLNPFTASGPWNLQLMRYGLATALLDDGGYSYDRGPAAAGTPWWFDEYDNGAGTALAQNISSTDDHIPVVNQALFQPGDTLTVEGELMRVKSTSPGLIYVTRGISSTVPSAHDAGAVVATPQQVQQGKGYLGQPLGAAYVVGSGTTNLISNGSFDTGSLTPWTLAVSPTVSATAGLDSSTYVDGMASASVTVNSVNLWYQGAELTQGPFALRGNQSYAITYWAKSNTEHNVLVQVCSAQGSCVADAQLGVNAAWTPYTVYFSAPGNMNDAQLSFSTADVTGTTWLDAVSVVQLSNPLLRRDFSNGTVLVNPSLQTQSVTLPKGYCHLHGDQNPSLNNGKAVSGVTIPAQDGVILPLCPIPTPTATPSPTPGGPTVTQTPSPSGTATATPPTQTDTPTSTATPTVSPTDTATPTGTDIPTATPTPRPTATATATTTPVPAFIVIGPTSLHPFQTVTVSGSNFLANEPIGIFWDSARTLLTSTKATAGGSFVARMSAPQAISGTHSIIAVGWTSAFTAAATVRVTPVTVLLHYYGTRGSRDVLSGFGFGAGETVYGYWTPGAIPLGPASGVSTTASGTFAGPTGITFTVPLSPTGYYRIYALGQGSHAIVASIFALTGPHRLAPRSSVVGSTAIGIGPDVTAIGMKPRYGANETVSRQVRRLYRMKG